MFIAVADLIRLVVSYERHMSTVFQCKLGAGVAGFDALALQPHFVTMPDAIMSTLYTLFPAPEASSLRVLPVFSADGAMAFLAWAAARHWVTVKDPNQQQVLYNLLADTLDSSTAKQRVTEKWYSMTSILLDESFGSGTVARFWRTYGWMDFLLMEGGWPWVTIPPPGASAAAKRAAEAGDRFPSPMRRLKPSAAGAVVPMLRPSAVGPAAHAELLKRGLKLPILLRDTTHSWALTNSEVEVLMAAYADQKELPTPADWTRALPALASGNENAEHTLKIVRSNVKLLYALQPVILVGHSLFWMQSRANLLEKVSTELQIPQPKILLSFNHRMSSMQGGLQAIEAADCAAANPIFIFLTQQLQHRRLQFNSQLASKFVLLSGKSGAGKTFNLALSVQHTAVLFVCVGSPSLCSPSPCFAVLSQVLQADGTGASRGEGGGDQEQVGGRFGEQPRCAHQADVDHAAVHAAV